jgi:hypothetical protein
LIYAPSFTPLCLPAGRREWRRIKMGGDQKNRDHPRVWEGRRDFMDIEKFLELTKKLDSKKKGKKEELENFKRFFERFHNLNRAYLDKETFERAEESISSMAAAIASTIQYLDAEITRLRNKRMKMPFENVELGEMQKIQNKNEMLIKEYLSGLPK